jgi:hypothetical protein
MRWAGQVALREKRNSYKYLEERDNLDYLGVDGR